MNTFDWDKFKAKDFVVNCKTKEEAKDFLQQAHEIGIVWVSDEPIIPEDSCWDFHEINTCYEYRDDYFGSVSGICVRGVAEYESTRTILSWSDFINEHEQDAPELD